MIQHEQSLRSVNPEILEIGGQELLDKEHSWTKVIFTEPEVKERITRMHESERSEKDTLICQFMKIDLDKELSAWASKRQPSKRQPPTVRGVKLQGWTKGEDDHFMACWPVNTLDGVEFASPSPSKTGLRFDDISWSPNHYIILHSSQEFFGHRRGGIMYYYMFRAWPTKENLEEP